MCSLGPAQTTSARWSAFATTTTQARTRLGGTAMAIPGLDNADAKHIMRLISHEGRAMLAWCDSPEGQCIEHQPCLTLLLHETDVHVHAHAGRWTVPFRASWGPAGDCFMCGSRKQTVWLQLRVSIQTTCGT